MYRPYTKKGGQIPSRWPNPLSRSCSARTAKGRIVRTGPYQTMPFPLAAAPSPAATAYR